MRYSSSLIFAATALIGLSSPVNAQDKNAPVTLDPTSHWNVNFAEDKCRLSRTFSDGENQHLLFIEQASPSSEFGFVVAGPAFKKFKRPDRITTQFGTLDPVEDHPPMLGDTESVGASLIYPSMVFFEAPDDNTTANEDPKTYSLPRLDVELADSTHSITIKQGKRRVIFNTGNLGEAVRVMNECGLSFVEDWGLDRIAHETMVRAPNWSNQNAIARRIQAVYPRQALRRGENGIFRLRVIVEADGSVSECVINSATVTESLDSPACKEMDDAKFEPALNAEGKPMRSFFVTNIIYRIG